MDEYIYVLDENLKNKLLLQNYKMLTETKVDNKKVYVFINNIQNKNKISFSTQEKKQCIFTNRLTF